jgi:hypothetical protein
MRIRVFWGATLSGGVSRSPPLEGSLSPSPSSVINSSWVYYRWRWKLQPHGVTFQKTRILRILCYFPKLYSNTVLIWEAHLCTTHTRLHTHFPYFKTSVHPADDEYPQRTLHEGPRFVCMQTDSLVTPTQKRKVHPRTGHEGPQGSRSIALLFL